MVSYLKQKYSSFFKICNKKQEHNIFLWILNSPYFLIIVFVEMRVLLFPKLLVHVQHNIYNNYIYKF